MRSLRQFETVSTRGTDMMFFKGFYVFLDKKIISYSTLHNKISDLVKSMNNIRRNVN